MSAPAHAAAAAACEVPPCAATEPIKLVFAGPMGAGKTTAIRGIADAEPVSTEMPMTDGARGDKHTTTVAFDFATIVLDDGQPLFVYGLPGQDYLAHMRPIILRGAIGVVLVLDGSAPDVAAHCTHWLASLRESGAPPALVIGVTKAELAPDFSLAALRAALGPDRGRVPVFTFDARDRQQAEHLVRALLVSIG